MNPFYHSGYGGGGGGGGGPPNPLDVQHPNTANISYPAVFGFGNGGGGSMGAGPQTNNSSQIAAALNSDPSVFGSVAPTAASSSASSSNSFGSGGGAPALNAIDIEIKPRVRNPVPRLIDKMLDEIAKPPKKRLRLVPIKEKEEVCYIDEKTSKLSESCHSTNYLELVSAIIVCFSPSSFVECKKIIDDIHEKARGVDPKKKYTYGNKICFSNAKRAVSHCTHFYTNATEPEFTQFLSWFNKEVYLPKPNDVKTVYLGYIPEEALKEDPDNEKHQKQSDVYILTTHDEISGISCKVSDTCPLTNWWIDNYLWHCKLKDWRTFFNSCITARKLQINNNLWKSNATNNRPCLIKKKIVTNARYKDCMREQWRVEDVPDRTEGQEPVFKIGTPMHCIQTIFKDENACKTIMTHAISDIFGQTLPYDFFLLAAGSEPLFLKMNGYSPNMESIKVQFDGADSWSGESAKFIFNVYVDCIENSSNKLSIFEFKVEIRRSGGADDYRMHFIINYIHNHNNHTAKKTAIKSHKERKIVVRKVKGPSKKKGGSRKLKRKSLRRRKTQRRK